MHKIAIADLDGTFLGAVQRISTKTKDSAYRCSHNAGKFVIATDSKDAKLSCEANTHGKLSAKVAPGTSRCRIYPPIKKRGYCNERLNINEVNL